MATEQTIAACFSELAEIVPPPGQEKAEHICVASKYDHGMIACEECGRVMDFKKQFEVDEDNDHMRIKEANGNDQQHTRKSPHDCSMEDTSAVKRVVRDLLFDCGGKRKPSAGVRKPRRRCRSAVNNIELATRIANETKLDTKPADVADDKSMEKYVELILRVLADARTVNETIRAADVAIAVLYMKSRKEGFDKHPLCGYDSYIGNHILNVRFLGTKTLLKKKSHTKCLNIVRKALRAFANKK